MKLTDWIKQKRELEHQTNQARLKLNNHRNHLGGIQGQINLKIRSVEVFLDNPVFQALRQGEEHPAEKHQPARPETIRAYEVARELYELEKALEEAQKVEQDLKEKYAKIQAELESHTTEPPKTKSDLGQVEQEVTRLKAELDKFEQAAAAMEAEGNKGILQKLEEARQIYIQAVSAVALADTPTERKKLIEVKDKKAAELEKLEAAANQPSQELQAMLSAIEAHRATIEELDAMRREGYAAMHTPLMEQQREAVKDHIRNNLLPLIAKHDATVRQIERNVPHGQSYASYSLHGLVRKLNDMDEGLIDAYEDQLAEQLKKAS